MSYQIISRPSKASKTGQFFHVYINGFFAGNVFSTLAEAEKFVEEYKKNRVVRS